VSDDLTVAAYRIDGFEGVILLRHFLSGTKQNSLASFIAALVDGAEGIVGGLLFLGEGGQSKKTQQDCEQNFLHRFSFWMACKGSRKLEKTPERPGARADET
jgi:hypothetical protein